MNRLGSSLLLLVVMSVLAPAGPTGAAVDDAAASPTAPMASTKKVAIKPGRYRGNFYTSSGKRLEEFTFKVTKDRKVKKFNAALNVTCSYYPPTVETHPLRFPMTPIKANGTFGKRWTPRNGSRIVLTGKLKKAKLLTGTLDYTVGVCVRTAQLQARRVGKRSFQARRAT